MMGSNGLLCNRKRYAGQEIWLGSNLSNAQNPMRGENASRHVSQIEHVLDLQQGLYPIERYSDVDNVQLSHKELA